MNAADLFDAPLLAEMLEGGYVRSQRHPELPLRIYNYSEKTAYESVWNEVTRTCRGLILDDAGEVVARPFEKFFNLGEPNAPEVALDAAAIVTDKADGSLGLLYPTDPGFRRYAIATRGSFVSDQAKHATEIWNGRYDEQWRPMPGVTFLFEILYPENRIVVDYGDFDDLILLAALDNETGVETWDHDWPGPSVEKFSYPTLAAALAAEPRPNREGLVVYLPEIHHGVRVKIKQEDYKALHRILTGTNARNVWEAAAVRSCYEYIREPKHWGSFLGIDPERAAELLTLGDNWLADVPDEFYDWVHEVTETAETQVVSSMFDALRLVFEILDLPDRRARYEHVSGHVMAGEVMRFASAERDTPAAEAAAAGLLFRCWREARPAPTSPFVCSEAIA